MKISSNATGSHSTSRVVHDSNVAAAHSTSTLVHDSNAAAAHDPLAGVFYDAMADPPAGVCDDAFDVDDAMMIDLENDGFNGCVPPEIK